MSIVTVPLLFLAVGFGQKLAVAEASELAAQYPVCVRARPVSKDGHRAVVTDVLWGEQLHKGDSFETTVYPPNPPGVETGPDGSVDTDSILFMKMVKVKGGASKWDTSPYRIIFNRNQVECHDSFGLPGEKAPPEITVESRVAFRANVPRKHGYRMSFPEVRAELLRLRSIFINWKK